MSEGDAVPADRPRACPLCIARPGFGVSVPAARRFGTAAGERAPAAAHAGLDAALALVAGRPAARGDRLPAAPRGAGPGADLAGPGLRGGGARGGRCAGGGGGSPPPAPPARPPPVLLRVA